MLNENPGREPTAEGAEVRNLHNDCGLLAVLRILEKDGVPFPEDQASFDRLREVLGKEDAGVVPAHLCNFLRTKGYGVQYYSQIDWEKCAQDFSEWDPRVRDLPQWVWDGFLDQGQFRGSAQYFSQEHNRDILQSQKLSLTEIQELLRNGKRIIAIVGRDHYVVVTGIDDHDVYIDNPKVQSPVVQESISYEDFLQWLRGTSLVDADEWHEVIVVSPPVCGLQRECNDHLQELFS